MTPQAFARYHAAVAREDLEPRGWGEFRFEYSMRGFFGRIQRCQKGMHWACSGRRGRRGNHTPCACPCHEIDGRRAYLQVERAVA
jgi:hypothetical protein